MKKVKGYAIFKSGYWLICPTEYLAYVSNDFKSSGIERVEMVEIKLKVKDEKGS